MVKTIRYLRDWRDIPKGTVENVDDKAAREFVEVLKYCEYVTEEIKKDYSQIKSKSTNLSTRNYLSLEEALKTIIKFDLLTEEEQDKIKEELEKIDLNEEGLKHWIKDNYPKQRDRILTKAQLINKTKEQKEKKKINQEQKITTEKFMYGNWKKESISNDQIKDKFKSFIIMKQSDEATELLVTQIKHREHIYTTRDDVQSEMWIYKEGIYVPEGKTHIKEWTRKILAEVYTETRANQVIAKIEADTYIERDQFFEKKNFNKICIKNGILDIVTKELKPFNPKLIFFTKLNCAYDPTKDCPNIKNHFKTILRQEDDINVIQELLGYILLNDNRFEKAFMWLGTGRNGKSKSLDLIKRWVGIENCSGLSLTKLEEKYNLAELHNKMLNIAGDIGITPIQKSEFFKTVTGQDLIQAERKYLKPIYFTNYAKLIFSANKLPKTYDITPAFWHRWIILEFPYTFVTEKEYELLNEEEKSKSKIKDENIIDKISSDEEFSGMLNWAILGLARLLKNKDFGYNKTNQEVKELWIRRSDSFMAFCMDCLEFSFDFKIEKEELRTEYAKYCQKYNLQLFGEKSIKSTLEFNYGVSEATLYYDMDHHHIWRGVKIKKVLPDSNNGLVQGFIESIEKSSSIGFKENPEPKYTEEDISIQDATPKFDKNNEKSNKTMKNVEKDEKYEKINHVNEKNEKIDTHRKSRSIFTSNGTFCIGNEFFRSLEEQYKDKLIPFEMFEKELLKHIDFDRVDKVINDLKLAGELFEPRPGFLARLE